MGRRRLYATAAERQKAHRQRQSQPLSETQLPAPRRRPPSRPARLAALIDGAQDLLDEYRDWLDRLPEAFGDTVLCELLTEAVERLEAAVESLEGLEPPRGFGRD